MQNRSGKFPDSQTGEFSKLGMEKLGTLKPRKSTEIRGSKIGIGFETLDRVTEEIFVVHCSQDNRIGLPMFGTKLTDMRIFRKFKPAPEKLPESL